MQEGVGVSCGGLRDATTCGNLVPLMETYRCFWAVCFYYTNAGLTSLLAPARLGQ